MPPRSSFRIYFSRGIYNAIGANSDTTAKMLSEQVATFYAAIMGVFGEKFAPGVIINHRKLRVPEWKLQV